MLKLRNPHIPISICCYLVCLFFPGYYIGERYEPALAKYILALGWLGPLAECYTWFANPLFLLALFSLSHPRRSAILSSAGLALALSFMLYENAPGSDADPSNPVVAYGWGYGLWVTSLAVFSVGQLLRAQQLAPTRIAVASITTFGLILGGYVAYYFVGDNSLFAIRSQRDREFEMRCASSGEHIFRRTNDVRGIFFDPDWQWSLGPKYRERPSVKYISRAGVIGLGHLNSGQLLFYETRARTGTGGYVKYVLGDRKETRSDSLESEYAVITDYFKIPVRLNISGASVTIKDRRDNSVLARSTFVIDRVRGRFCGNSREHFSTSAFMREVLGLTNKKYSSAFE